MSSVTINSVRNQVRITEPGRASLETVAFAPSGPCIDTDYSVVSAGTERSILAGTEAWAPLPFVPGYGAVGRVLSGGAALGLADGQRVFTYGKHASQIEPNGVTVAVPDAVDSRHAALARMAMVAITAQRIKPVELGDRAVVVGAGLVGQFAAQLLRLQGARVIVVDVDPERRAIAEQCGALATYCGRDPDVVAKITDATDGGAELVVEATGITDLVPSAVSMAGPQGTVVLLGSPRSAFSGDARQLLWDVHAGNSVALRGGIEWQVPPQAHPKRLYKHSLERNLRIILHLIAHGDVLCEPLISHVAKPETCQAVYDQVATGASCWLGVLFDWR
ncbi:MAG: zinc-binding alcohol dehydrogenase [Planctomycetota bacterium]|jgi:threonine dehydrogenase-like Zn-dependent dehydrogenase|nr:zinc-binding alcohol dehydrogenase [Planctomycetota bacterium]